MAAPKKSGLGRGLGELFQRTDPESMDDVSRETSSSAPDPVPTPDVSRETSPRRKPAVPRETTARLTGEDGETNGSVGKRAEEAFLGSVPPRRGAAEEMPSGARFAELSVGAIEPNRQQPRQVFDEEDLDELSASIAEVGLLQPVIVREAGAGQYELVMGERRWRATRQAGLDTIPAIIRPTEQHDMLRDALLENLHRVQLNPLEEAAAYQQLLEDFACTQEELSAKIKRSRPQIANTIRLLKLPPTVQRRVAAGVLSAGHARALLGLTEPLAQEQLAQRVVAEGLSVRATEEIVTLAGHSKPNRPGRTPRERSARAIELSDRLSDHFETRARVDIGRNKGKIVIEFASHDDLERILGIIDPSRDGIY